MAATEHSYERKDGSSLSHSLSENAMNKKSHSLSENAMNKKRKRDDEDTDSIISLYYETDVEYKEEEKPKPKLKKKKHNDYVSRSDLDHFMYKINDSFNKKFERLERSLKNTEESESEPEERRHKSKSRKRTKKESMSTSEEESVSEEETSKSKKTKSSEDEEDDSEFEGEIGNGKPIGNEAVKFIKKRYINKADKTKFRNMLKKYKSPKNATFLRAKTTNREVWTELPLESRNIDAKLTAIQRNVAKATTALARAIEDEDGNGRDMMEDGIRLMAACHRQVSEVRRKMQRPLLPYPIQRACDAGGQEEHEEFLYGEKFNKKNKRLQRDK